MYLYVHIGRYEMHSKVDVVMEQMYSWRCTYLVGPMWPHKSMRYYI